MRRPPWSHRGDTKSRPSRCSGLTAAIDGLRQYRSTKAMNFHTRPLDPEPVGPDPRHACCVKQACEITRVLIAENADLFADPDFFRATFVNGLT